MQFRKLDDMQSGQSKTLIGNAAKSASQGTALRIQDDSPYLLDENPAALLAGSQIEAAGLSRCLKTVRLWSQSSAVSRPRREELIEEEQRLANLYAAILLEIGSAFGIEKADALSQYRGRLHSRRLEMPAYIAVVDFVDGQSLRAQYAGDL